MNGRVVVLLSLLVLIVPLLKVRDLVSVSRLDTRDSPPVVSSLPLDTNGSKTGPLRVPPLWVRLVSPDYLDSS